MLLSCFFFFFLSWWNDIKQNPDDANDVFGLTIRVPGIIEGTGMGKIVGCRVTWLGESLQLEELIREGRAGLQPHKWTHVLN